MGKILLSLTADVGSIVWPIATVPFNNVVLDTDGIFAPGDPGIITVPTGASRIKLYGSVAVPNNGATGTLFPTIRKNDVETFCGLDMRRNSSSGYSNNACFTVAPWQPCIPGDEFMIRVNVSGLGNPTSILAGVNSWFGAEFE